MCKKSEMQFSIFLIYQLSQQWKRTPADVYRILSDTKILDDYIAEHPLEK